MGQVRIPQAPTHAPRSPPGPRPFSPSTRYQHGITAGGNGRVLPERWLVFCQISHGSEDLGPGGDRGANSINNVRETTQPLGATGVLPRSGGWVAAPRCASRGLEPFRQQHDHLTKQPLGATGVFSFIVGPFIATASTPTRVWTPAATGERLGCVPGSEEHQHDHLTKQPPGTTPSLPGRRRGLDPFRQQQDSSTE